MPTEQERQLNYLLELCVGHMVRRQGIDDTIEFVKDLKDEHPMSQNSNWSGLVEATIEEIRNEDYS